MATIGKTTTTGTPTSATSDKLWCVGPFAMSENGALDQISLYVTGNLSIAQDFIFGVYEDDSNYPGTKVATSAVKEGPHSGPGWFRQDITGNLENGKSYWLVWNGTDGVETVYDAGDTYFPSYTYDGTLPNTYPAAAAYIAREYAVYADYTPGAADSIAISTPTIYTVVQRNGSSEGDISITGTFSGSPTAIEAQFNSGGWETIDASPSGGAFSGTLSAQTAGQGDVEVRFTNDTAVSDSVTLISITDIFIAWGQSNCAGRLDNMQSWSHATLTPVMFRDATWQELDDPAGDDNSYGTPWPLVATNYMAATGLPFVIIQSAKGSTGLVTPDDDWSQGGSAYIDALSNISNSGITDAKAVLWLQGERDVANSISQSAYQTALSAMLDDLQTDVSISGLKLVAAQLLRNDSATRSAQDDVRAAQAYTWDNDSDIYAGPVLCDLVGDGLHIVSDAEGQILADRWWHFLDLAFYGGSEGRGPRVLSTVKVSDTVVRVVFTVANSPLQNPTDTTGWRVEDDTGVLGIVSTAAFGVGGVDITVNRTLDTNPVVSWASLNDASTSTLTDTSTYDLPPEPFFDFEINTILPNKLIVPLADNTVSFLGKKVNSGAVVTRAGSASLTNSGKEGLNALLAALAGPQALKVLGQKGTAGAAIISQILDDQELAAAGKSGLNGAIDQTLSDLVLAALGQKGTTGAIATSLDLIVSLLGFESQVIFSGVIDSSLGDNALSTIGNTGATGGVSAQLGNLVALLTGASGHTGDMSVNILTGVELLAKIGVTGVMDIQLLDNEVQMIEITVSDKIYQILISTKTGQIKILAPKTGSIDITTQQ